MSENKKGSDELTQADITWLLTTSNTNLTSEQQEVKRDIHKMMFAVTFGGKPPSTKNVMPLPDNVCAVSSIQDQLIATIEDVDNK